MKLSIELMPESCWGQSLRKRMKPYRWSRLREQVIAEQGDECEICGATGRLHCHEVWEYDDDQHVQKLVGLRMICPLCHGVEHYGMTNLLAAQGSVSLQDYTDHFCRVNGVGEDAFSACLAKARCLHAERSKHDWTTHLGDWSQLAGDEPAPHREPEYEGRFWLPGSRIDSATVDSQGNLGLRIMGSVPVVFRHGYPRYSPSSVPLKLTIRSCAQPEQIELPAVILSASVSFGQFCHPFTPLPLTFNGPVEVDLTLESGGNLRLSGAGIDIDRVDGA